MLSTLTHVRINGTIGSNGDNLRLAIKSAKELQVLDLTGTQVDLRDVVDGLNQLNRPIKRLILSSNDISCRGLPPLLDIRRFLVHLDLSCNNIWEDGARTVAQLVASSPSLTSLDLSMNSLRDRGAMHIAKSLKGNKILRKLYLSGNFIFDNGAIVIIEAIPRAQALVIVDLSRNTTGVRSKYALLKMREQRLSDCEVSMDKTIMDSDAADAQTVEATTLDSLLEEYQKNLLIYQKTLKAEKELARITQENNDVLSGNAEELAKVLKLREQASSLKHENKNLRKNLTKLEKAIGEAKAETAIAHENLSILNTRQSKQQLMIHNLTATLEELNSKKSMYEKQCNELGQRLEEEKKQYDAWRLEMENTRERINHNDNILDVTEETILGLETDTESFMNTIKDYENERSILAESSIDMVSESKLEESKIEEALTPPTDDTPVEKSDKTERTNLESKIEKKSRPTLKRSGPARSNASLASISSSVVVERDPRVHSMVKLLQHGAVFSIRAYGSSKWKSPKYFWCASNLERLCWNSGKHKMEVFSSIPVAEIKDISMSKMNIAKSGAWAKIKAKLGGSQTRRGELKNVILVTCKDYKDSIELDCGVASDTPMWFAALQWLLSVENRERFLEATGSTRSLANNSNRSMDPNNSNRSLDPNNSNRSLDLNNSNRSMDPNNSNRSMDPNNSNRSMDLNNSNRSLDPNSSNQSLDTNGSNRSLEPHVLPKDATPKLLDNIEQCLEILVHMQLQGGKREISYSKLRKELALKLRMDFEDRDWKEWCNRCIDSIVEAIPANESEYLFTEDEIEDDSL